MKTETLFLFAQVLLATATPKQWMERREEARGRKRRAERGMAGEGEEEGGRVEEERRGMRNGTKSWMEELKMA